MLAGTSPHTSDAAESAAGFYLLGSHGNFAALVPPPGFYIEYDQIIYTTSEGANVPQGGRLHVDLDATAILPFVTGIWAPDDVEVAGMRPYFSLSIVSGWKHTSASAELTGPGGMVFKTNTEESDYLLGDPVAAVGLGGGTGPFFWSGLVSVNIPIGDYEKGRSTNVSFNRWGVDTTLSLTWFDQPSGWEISTATGLTFNGENPTTSYDTGTEWHIEAAFSKSFASGLQLGFAGYHYDQITGDSGSGAVLGGFEGRVTGVGPTIGYTLDIGATPVTIKARYFHEFGAKNRFAGEVVYLTLAAPIQF